MNRDELEGKAKTIKGQVKQAVGAATKNPNLHDEGVVDEVDGRAQDAAGHVRRKVGQAIADVGNALKK